MNKMVEEINTFSPNERINWINLSKECQLIALCNIRGQKKGEKGLVEQNLPKPKLSVTLERICKVKTFLSLHFDLLLSGMMV